MHIIAIVAAQRRQQASWGYADWNGPSLRCGPNGGRPPRLSMTSIDTAFLRRCLDALERALEGLRRHGSDDVLHEVFRALLKKRLRPWFASNRQADRLAFRDVFRHAAKHGLIDAGACERWLRYRDNRNDTALDYGVGFAEATLKLLPGFLTDARALADVVEAADEATDDG